MKYPQDKGFMDYSTFYPQGIVLVSARLRFSEGRVSQVKCLSTPSLFLIEYF